MQNKCCWTLLPLFPSRPSFCVQYSHVLCVTAKFPSPCLPCLAFLHIAQRPKSWCYKVSFPILTFKVWANYSPAELNNLTEGVNWKLRKFASVQTLLVWGLKADLSSSNLKMHLGLDRAILLSLPSPARLTQLCHYLGRDRRRLRVKWVSKLASLQPYVWSCRKGSEHNSPPPSHWLISPGRWLSKPMEVGVLRLLGWGGGADSPSQGLHFHPYPGPEGALHPESNIRSKHSRTSIHPLKTSLEQLIYCCLTQMINYHFWEGKKIRNKNVYFQVCL